MRIINRKARRDYEIVDEIEAGLVLAGAEVKSLRQGRGTLMESFARVKDGEVWLHNFVIPPYIHGSEKNYDPARTRKILLHKTEILSIFHKIESKRLTLIPLACYTTGRFVKIKLGLGRGKKEYEKKEAKKRKDLERELEIELKNKK